MFEQLKEIRYDKELRLEAYQFNGIVQVFPNHFHEYYVIGLIEEGQRRLIVNNQEYTIGPGDMMTFNPLDNHKCEQTDGGSLRYRCLNITQEVMAEAFHEVKGYAGLPRFQVPVQHQAEAGGMFRNLHDRIMTAGPELEKEEAFLVCLEQLITTYAVFKEDKQIDSKERQEIRVVCDFLEQHYAERITLQQLSKIAKLNKFGLIRLFTRHKGITPYRYLETIRINEAKKLLEKGVEPAQAAFQTGFSDQSHLNSYFNKFIGVTPGVYQLIFREEQP
ncbi:AraC family transcriptional regulator [Enterococcus florum]|uniref:AraC family transcriptional regulator n=1 Tax=Enterococcus florum TaxID=2480627 RepID=A0A4P5PC70_9ENTE|nr:AraC family transcriptional regulator [Enterococcus florum]GCF93032.1 AraC family transcriptional regulator [Enterococcus florum]